MRRSGPRDERWFSGVWKTRLGRETAAGRVVLLLERRLYRGCSNLRGRCAVRRLRLEMVLNVDVRKRVLGLYTSAASRCDFLVFRDLRELGSVHKESIQGHRRQIAYRTIVVDTFAPQSRRHRLFNLSNERARSRRGGGSRRNVPSDRLGWVLLPYKLIPVSKSSSRIQV